MRILLSRSRDTYNIHTLYITASRKEGMLVHFTYQKPRACFTEAWPAPVDMTRVSEFIYPGSWRDPHTPAFS